MPSSLIQEELVALRRYLELRKDDLLAPTAEQLGNLIRYIDGALVKWGEVTHPADDPIYLVDVQKDHREE